MTVITLKRRTRITIRINIRKSNDIIPVKRYKTTIGIVAHNYQVELLDDVS